MSINPIEVLGRPAAPTRTLVSKLWRKYVLRGISANDNHAGLDKLYALPDPWGMDSAREQSRFAQTNAVIEARAGHVGSMLEIGSGEGHQSAHLATLADRLDGLEVSERAVLRARERFTGDARLRFGAGDLDRLPFEPPAGGYDLVVACEVLYYMSDIGHAVQRMSSLGRACLVTFFAPSARVVARHLEALPGAERGWIYHDPYAWLWVYWRNR